MLLRVRGIGIVTRLSPIQRVESASSGACHMNPRTVSTNVPPAFSQCRPRLNECSPTASKTTSYALPFLVKSSRV